MRRPYYLEQIGNQLRVHSVCALLGPRQVGKTTLAKKFAEEYTNDEVRFFDLENPMDLAQLTNPYLMLSRLPHRLIVIDEIQLRPDLFPVLRVLVDENKKRKFLILGSASRDLIQQSSETLAGRIGYLELPPFSLEEATKGERLWIRGGFPRSYLAADDEDSFLWRQSYVMTFLERDIPALGFQIPPQNMRRFWLMLAHYHGQILNASDFGRSLGLTHHTVRKYLDILTGTFMVRTLTPWFENISKRQVKSPKIYFRDSGLLHCLLGLENIEQLLVYPKLGAAWEGFALEEIIRSHHATPDECYFWATQGGAELDLLLAQRGQRLGFEFKYTENPKITLSMRTSMNDLQLNHLYVVVPGKASFPLDERITVVGLDVFSQPFR